MRMREFKKRWLAGIVPTLVVMVLVIRSCGSVQTARLVEEAKQGHAHVEAAQAFLEAGRYEDAMAEYELALQIQPNWDVVLDNMELIRKRLSPDALAPIPQESLPEEARKALDRGDYHSARVFAMHIKDEAMRIAFFQELNQVAPNE